MLDTIRSFLISATLSEWFLGEATLTPAYTNRVFSPTIHNKSPLNSYMVNLLICSIFGVPMCIFVSTSIHEQSKLELKSRLCSFIGDEKSYGYYDLLTKRLHLFCHVIFWEHKPFTSLSPFPESPTHYSPIFPWVVLPSSLLIFLQVL